MIHQVTPFALRLEDNLWVVALIIAFLAINIIGWNESGVMRLQAHYMRETRSSRTFLDTGITTFNPLRPILLLQFFLFSGLCIFSVLGGYTPAQLAQPSQELWLVLAFCIGVPFSFFLFQWATFNWLNYLLGDQERIKILNRLYLAIHMLASPLAFIIFIIHVTGLLLPGWTLFLLCLLFILCQLIFIFNGFKIFLTSFGSLCFIIVYLCALEIAPLALFWHKMGLSAPSF